MFYNDCFDKKNVSVYIAPGPGGGVVFKALYY